MKHLFLGGWENGYKENQAEIGLDSGCFLGCSLVLVNSDSSPGCNVMLLCSVTASAFCLNDLITHTHEDPKMKK